MQNTMSPTKTPAEQKVSGNWKQFTGKIKETWGELTNDDLDRYEGQKAQLEGLIQERTGESREKIREKIDAIASAVKARF